MPNQETPWWEDEKYRSEVNGSCDTEECWHDYYNVQAIVAESERLGIEKGKREALEWVKRIVKKETTKWYQPNPGSFILDAINAKLSSLSQSSNE